MHVRVPQLKLKISKKPRGYWLFPIFNFLAFIAAYFYNIRAGAVACVVILGYYIIDSSFLKVFYDHLFVSYLLINIISVYAYLFNHRPIELFFTCVSYNIIPMLLYGIGFCLQWEENDNPIFKSICISNVIIVAIGLIVYSIPPLAAYLGKYSITTAGIDSSGIGYRFDSYLDSLTMGSLCAINIPIIMLNKFRHKYSRVLYLGITVIGLFLTLQRGAWIIGGVGFLGSMMINIVFEKRNGFKEFFKYLLLLVIAGIVVYYFATHYLSEGLTQHLMIRLKRLDFASMMSDRNYQIAKGFKVFSEYPFGFGLGSAGIKAAKYGLQIVPDGNILKILVETGIIGLFLFVCLNIRAFFFGLRYKKYYSVLIIGLFLIHCIGSNVLDFYYSSFVYWFVLGYLNGSRREGA
jgi:hypothetical protein